MVSTPQALPGETPPVAQTPAVKAGAWLQRLLNNKHSIAIIASLAVIVAICIVLILWTSSANYRPLYGNQENFDSANIIEILESEGVNYQLMPSTGQVMVAEDKVGELRLLLAARGVQAQLPSGVSDIAGDITSSQFMEQARYRHALEGELSRTLMTLESVRSVRVHLAIPKQRLFLRQEDAKPSASVMLDLVAGKTLSASQVSAVVNLVVGSVPGLEVSRVKVVNQSGMLLNGGGDELLQDGLSDRQIQYQSELERQLIQRAESMLLPLLGIDQFKVQVSASINFDKIEETRESLDQDPVLRQENVTARSGVPQAKGVPGTLSNEPPALDATEESKTILGTSQDLNSDYQRSFDVGRSVRRTRYQQARLEQLSVSILVNETVTESLGWDAQRLATVSGMLQDAVGFSEARGDQFSLASLPFARTEIAEPVQLAWWESLEIESYLRYLVGLILGLLLIFVVIRPLIRSITATSSRESTELSELPTEKVVGNGEGVTVKDEEPAAPALPTLPDNFAELDLATQQRLMREAEVRRVKEEMATYAQRLKAVSLVPKSDASLDVQFEHLGQLAAEEPEKVAEVIEKLLVGGQGQDDN